MTLNFASYGRFFDPIRSDDEFGSISYFNNNSWLSWEFNDLYENEVDPIDLLPADPFGMELGSNLAAAIAGLIQDLGAGSNDCGSWDTNYGFEPNYLAIPNVPLDSVFGIEKDLSLNDTSVSHSNDCGLYLLNESHESGGSGFSFISNYGSFGLEHVTFDPIGGAEEEDRESSPHDGLLLSLGHLGVDDLLSVDRVCKSLHSAVQNDPLLWRCIHIRSPLSERINDEVLLRLCSKAQGSLQCLSLVQCPKITDGGLWKVLESNPRLHKLSVADCVSLTMDGLINNLRSFKSLSVTGIKNLMLGRLFIVSSEHYEELQLIVGGDGIKQGKPYKPRFFHKGVSSIACDNNDRAIDIEMCSGCQKFTMVFDCTAETCQGKGVEHCRACVDCINRCKRCGRCVNDCRFYETFFLDFLCSDCWKETPDE